MKASDTPEKVYISAIPSEFGGYKTITCSMDFPNAVEYIRADTFIEKACNAFCKKCKMPNCRSNECKMISDFKGHLQTNMEGE